jgi:hypothetical protein
MVKFAILGVTSLAFVGTAVAADLPQPQPVAAPTQVGKYPLGKSPVGKYPIGKAPAPAPLVTKGRPEYPFGDAWPCHGDDAESSKRAPKKPKQ